MQRLHSPASTSVGRLPCADRPALQLPAVRQAATARPTLRVAAVITDQAVPEGHKGLHGFLYGESGAEVHDQQSQYHFRQVLLLFPVSFGSHDTLAGPVCYVSQTRLAPTVLCSRQHNLSCSICPAAAPAERQTRAVCSLQAVQRQSCSTRACKQAKLKFIFLSTCLVSSWPRTMAEPFRPAAKQCCMADEAGLTRILTQASAKAAQLTGACSQGQDEGQELTPVASYLGERERDTARGVGVYALYDERQQLQYVGYARNVAGAIQVRLGPHRHPCPLL